VPFGNKSIDEGLNQVLTTAALSEYLSRFGLLADEAGEISQEVKNIGAQKWIKIMNASHAWNKVAVSQADIEAIVSKPCKAEQICLMVKQG